MKLEDLASKVEAEEAGTTCCEFPGVRSSSTGRRTRLGLSGQVGGITKTISTVCDPSLPGGAHHSACAIPWCECYCHDKRLLGEVTEEDRLRDFNKLKFD